MFRAKLCSWIGGTFGRSRFESEVNDELQFHIEARATDLIKRAHLPADEGTRRARIEFGSIEKWKEETREAVGLRFLDDLRRDVSYAFRMLRKNPAFTLTAVVI